MLTAICCIASQHSVDYVQMQLVHSIKLHRDVKFVFFLNLNSIVKIRIKFKLRL